MKKIIISIIIFLFTSGKISYAQLYKDNDVNNNKTSVLDAGSSSTTEETNNKTGLFKAEGEIQDRPRDGGGVGQLPVGDGAYLLFIYCLFLGIFKIYGEKKKKKTAAAKL